MMPASYRKTAFRLIALTNSSTSDGRARNAWLTGRGLKLLRAAQATHFAGVQRRFFDHMEPEEVSGLAATFGRFAPDGAGSCTG